MKHIDNIKNKVKMKIIRNSKKYNNTIKLLKIKDKQIFNQMKAVKKMKMNWKLSLMNFLKIKPFQHLD